MTDQTIRVGVSTEQEAYPVLGLWWIGNPRPDEGFAIPKKLWDDLCEAQGALDDAEAAIMRHVGANYPEASYVHEWLRDIDKETAA